MQYSECNHVRTERPQRYHSIGACESETSQSSFKYVCKSNDEVQKLVYDTFGCQGEPSSILNIAETNVRDYECNNALSCPYALSCVINNCGRKCNLCSRESNLRSLAKNHDIQCKTLITDRCLKDGNFYLGRECRGDVIIITDYDDRECVEVDFRDFDDKKCFRGKYTYVDCNP